MYIRDFAILHNYKETTLMSPLSKADHQALQAIFQPSTAVEGHSDVSTSNLSSYNQDFETTSSIFQESLVPYLMLYRW